MKVNLDSAPKRWSCSCGDAGTCEPGTAYGITEHSIDVARLDGVLVVASADHTDETLPFGAAARS